ncbi:glycosyltransferase [Mycoplasmopsis primatum]|uniref:glycosyltransferase n=1 Tax=Mycoplasmopsis primatum TaxID=55604 RepID=UPI000497A003|nr:glycosyltransferase family 2 protein [Mycoplasmopsis primatum]
MKKLVKQRKVFFISIVLFFMISAFLFYLSSNSIITYFKNENFFNADTWTIVKQISMTILFVINIFIICYFWWLGINDLMQYIIGLFEKRNNLKIINEIHSLPISLTDKKVILAYCTCNDFNEEALLTSSIQNYLNYKVVILDDSTNKEYIDKINEFVKKYPNIELVRRKTKEGFKAGNINNYFLNKSDYDYLVILDSDEIIPTNFIIESLKYFKYYSNVGIVQANHKGRSTGITNNFQKWFSVSILPSLFKSLWPRNKNGLVNCFGHGAMISKECFDKVGGFPQVVSEDNAFTLKMLYENIFVVFAPNIICQEDFPINLSAFIKRQGKFINGNIEMSKMIVKKRKGNYPKWLKFELFSHVSMIYLTIIFGFIFQFNNVLIFTFNRDFINHNIYIYLISLFFIFIPWIKEILNQHKYISFFSTIFYFIISFTIIFSIFICSIKMILFSIFHKKPNFIVTPKKNYKFKLLMFIKQFWFEFLLCVLMIVFCSLPMCIYGTDKWHTLFFAFPFVWGFFGVLFLSIAGNNNNSYLKIYESKLLSKIFKEGPKGQVRS